MKSTVRNKKNVGLKVAKVLPNSIAEKKGIKPGDILLTINNNPIRDLIDFHIYSTDERPSILLKSTRNKMRKIIIGKEPDEDIGIIFHNVKPRRCNNNCIFCFINQMPKGLRKSLYIKDEDYRLSFLYGNYITATNLSDEDIRRIIKHRLSPLYLSIHTTNPTLREFMLCQKNIPDIMDVIKIFADNNVHLHTQIVLCKAINNGIELENTLQNLYRFYPHIESIAIVPVGLTKFRKNLFPLKKITPQYAKDLIKKINSLQKKYKNTYGENIIFLADEFYLLADEPLPSFKHYGDFPQFENGVGMVTYFMKELNRIKNKLPKKIEQKKKVGIITSKLSQKFLKNALLPLNKIENLSVKIIPVKNNLFGEMVTVTGLLSGKDIFKAIASHPKCDHYIIPGNTLKIDENLFLDDLTFDDLKNRIKKPVSVVGYSIKDLIDNILSPLGKDI